MYLGCKTSGAPATSVLRLKTDVPVKCWHIRSTLVTRRAWYTPQGVRSDSGGPQKAQLWHQAPGLTRNDHTGHFEPARLGAVVPELASIADADADEAWRPSTRRVRPATVLPRNRPPRRAAIISAVGQQETLSAFRGKSSRCTFACRSQLKNGGRGDVRIIF
jgi:hypothetical protein